MEASRTISEAFAVLEYPNGRTVEVAVATPLEPGDEFELYGRRWQAVKALQRSRRVDPDEPTRMLCRSTAQVAVLLNDPRD